MINIIELIKGYIKFRFNHNKQIVIKYSPEDKGRTVFIKGYDDIQDCYYIGIIPIDIFDQYYNEQAGTFPNDKIQVKLEFPNEAQIIFWIDGINDLFDQE